MSTITDFAASFKKLVQDRVEYSWANAREGSESMGAYLEIDWEQLNMDIDEFVASFKTGKR